MTDGSESKKVQLGGRIVQLQVSGGTVTLLVGQLPIVDYQAYGPKDNRKNNGDFAIIFQGQVEKSDLQTGNRVMAAGVTRPWKVVTVNDLTRSYPIVEAQCLYFWNTRGRDIEDFPFRQAGYTTPRQETVYAKSPTP
jgi:starvation-inducible outer membrane lipoprotein